MAVEEKSGMVVARPITDDELMRMPRDGQKYEVVDGELRVSPAGPWHELIVTGLITQLGTFVRSRALGHVLGSNVEYGLPNRNRRCPDVSFVAADRLPTGTALKELLTRSGIFEIVPDLVVEILSPSNSPREVLDKIGDYLTAGVRLVWIIDPIQERAVVHRALTSTREIPPDGALEGEDVVPGFRCLLRELFP